MILMPELAGIQAIHAMVLTFARLIRNLARLKFRCLGTATACFVGNITICLMSFGTPGFVYGVALCSLAAIIAIIVLLKRRRYSTCSMPM